MSAESAALSLALIRTFNKDKVPFPKVDSKRLESFIANSPHLAVEIGCGVGLHPTNWAKANPHRQILAIEKTAEKFRKFQKRFEDEGKPANLLPIHTHAVSVVTHFLKDESVEEYFILFPNPEPKSPQSRWIRMPFFSELLRTLKPNGKIHFATNEESYNTEIEEFAVKAWKLTLENKKVVNDINSTIPRTHFEKKYLERGQGIYSTTWIKNSR